MIECSNKKKTKRTSLGFVFAFVFLLVDVEVAQFVGVFGISDNT